MKMFLEKLSDIFGAGRIFSATPPRPPQFSATEISAIPNFWPKILFWALSRSCSTRKWHQHLEIVFWKNFRIVLVRAEFFSATPPRPPQLSTSEISARYRFWVKNGIFWRIRQRGTPKGDRYHPIFFCPKIWLFPWIIEKKSQKGLEWVLAPQGTLKILVVGQLWVCRMLPL